MEINREQERGATLRIGTPGNQSAINIMRAASGEIVRNLDSKGYQEAKQRISGEIPDPTFGYLIGSSSGYREKDDALRNNLAEWDLSNLAYVDHFGQTDTEETSMCQKDGRMRRCHMRRARGCGPFGDRRGNLPTLAIDKVAIQKDILEGELVSIDITDGDRGEVQHELDLIRNRWGSGRNKGGIDPRKRPLITSTEWIRIQAREKIGWTERQSLERENNGFF